MTALVAGPVALACALLVAAGVSKLKANALLGVAEIVLGTAAFVDHRLFPVVALTYAAFVVVAWRAKAKQRACGCFGSEERLPTTAHVVLNAALAISTLAAMTSNLAPLHYLGFTYAVLIGTATYLGVAVMTA